MPVVRSVTLPFVHVEYDRSPPSAQQVATTRAGSIGVSFTAQRSAVWEVGGRTAEGFFPAAVSMPGASDLVWQRWSDVSEALEFWLDENWLAGLSGIKGATRSDPQTGFSDPVLVAVATQFRRSMICDAVDSLRFEELAIVAAKRIIKRWRRMPDASRVTPLDERRLRLVVSFVEENLAGPLTLETLADVASSSVFHFAKRFRQSTGVAPYAYVIGCRMTRAMQLLRSGATVRRVAESLGYSQIGHFRRQFQAHWGQAPGRLAD
jgi:AraC family transcriptional regulator